MIRKFTVLVLLICTVTFSTWADDYLKPSLTENVPGQYVYYLDTRGEEIRYVGYLLAGEGDYLIRVYYPERDVESKLNIRASIDTRGVPSIDSIGAQMGGEKLAEEISIDLLNIIGQRGSIDERIFPDPVTFIDPWPNFGYTLIHTYQFWIPLFQLQSSVDKDNPDKGLVLIHFGKSSGQDNKGFLSFKGVPAAVPGPPLVLPRRKSMSVEINGLKVPLDENWETDDGKLYEIRVGTEQTAAFLIESVNLDYQQIDDIMILIRYLIQGNPDKHVLINSVAVSQYKKMPVAEFSVMDPETNKITKQISLCIPRGGPVWSIATIITADSVYNLNRDYFNRILF